MLTNTQPEADVEEEEDKYAAEASLWHQQILLSEDLHQHCSTRNHISHGFSCAFGNSSLRTAHNSGKELMYFCKLHQNTDKLKDTKGR